MRDMQADVFEVNGYWNEMHLPEEIVRQFGLKKGCWAKLKWEVTKRHE